MLVAIFDRSLKLTHTINVIQFLTASLVYCQVMSCMHF